jgi:hypothetical protein
MITSNSNFVVDQMILVSSIDAFYEHDRVKRKHDDEYLHKDYGFFLSSIQEDTQKKKQRLTRGKRERLHDSQWHDEK